MKLRLPGVLLLAALTTAGLAAQEAAQQAPERFTRNLILVTIDGLRWQDVFTGADNRMMNKEHGGVRDILATRKRFWRGEPVQRREVLMPFLWGTVAKDGQLFGDPEAGAQARVTNTQWFSYPGYSELFCGKVDPKIDSNNKFPNPNVNVLEWLHQKTDFGGRIAVFSGWDVIPYVLNEDRSRLFVESGWDPVTVARTPERREAIQEVFDHLPRYWEEFAWDVATFARAKEYFLHAKPRVLCLSLGETDEWGHGRRYDLYLQMANKADAMIRELWELAQADDQYRGTTSLVVAVDHGRGRTEKDWTDHSAKVPGADEVWMAVMGPDTPALGVRRDVQATQSMIAATVAALLGEDFTRAGEGIAAPLPGVLK